MSRIKSYQRIPVQLVNINFFVLLLLFIFTICFTFTSATLSLTKNDTKASSFDLIPNCADLPHADFLTTQQLDFTCEHRKMWFMDRDSKISKEFIDHTTGKYITF